MPSYHVERTTVIDKTLLNERDMLKDFKLWHKWSSWMEMEIYIPLRS